MTISHDAVDKEAPAVFACVPWELHIWGGGCLSSAVLVQGSFNALEAGSDC